jgi:uncharacterized membrane protein
VFGLKRERRERRERELTIPFVFLKVGLVPGVRDAGVAKGPA